MAAARSHPLAPTQRLPNILLRHGVTQSAQQVLLPLSIGTLLPRSLGSSSSLVDQTIGFAAIATSIAVARKRTHHAALANRQHARCVLRCSGKVAIVTGASCGVGKATVEGLVESGQFTHIVLAGRNSEKYQLALDGIGQAFAGRACPTLTHLDLELASLKSVRTFVKAFERLELPSLDVLVLNAGVMMIPELLQTEDGFERQMGVNHCGHFALLNLLLPKLTASGSDSAPARVISLSSSAHLADSPLANGDLQDLMFSANPEEYSAVAAYAQSKLANVLMAYELDRRAREDDLPISISAVHPGGVQTDLGRYMIDGMADPATGELSEMALNMPAWQEGLIRGIVNTFITPKTPEQGAKTSVLLATCAPEELSSGFYWTDEQPVASLGQTYNPMSDGTSYDESVWKRFWEMSEGWTGVEYDPSGAK